MNTYAFTIEIPAGHDRRIHLNYAKTEFADFGAIADKITANSGLMPTTYGFLQGVVNTDEAGEHEEYLDAIALDEIPGATADRVQVYVVGMFEREDGDHKVLVAVSPLEFTDIDPLLQQTLLDFHGFHKKITKIYSATEAEQYVAKCRFETEGLSI